MADSLQKVLNPHNETLTDEQEEVLTLFTEVESEMASLDRLSALIGARIKESTSIH
ncbi:hypothetical protein P5704_025365 (plasmid) [Pseudomonas sp. FeN3W]|nr:hypothetical protein P5704_025365 [Pseudomonas sp. FeN3W]